MSFLDVSRIILSFESEDDTLEYLTNAIQCVIANYNNNKPFVFNDNEFDDNIELLCIINTIIKKLKKLKQPSEPSESTDIK